MCEVDVDTFELAPSCPKCGNFNVVVINLFYEDHRYCPKCSCSWNIFGDEIKELQIFDFKVQITDSEKEGKCHV